MCNLRLRLNQSIVLTDSSQVYEPGRNHDPDTIFYNYEVEITVESRTFIRARPQGPGYVANASGIMTPYGLRTTIPRCKGLRFLLSTKSHTQPLKGLRWPQCSVQQVYEITASER
jgi:hypothetical protein